MRLRQRKTEPEFTQITALSNLVRKWRQIRENIVYSKEGVTDEQMIAACKAVGLHHFIKTLPEGYDTVLSDNASLSAGQRQLVTIARAMIENAPMLILDEATSSVDTRTEIQIQNAMDVWIKKKSILSLLCNVLWNDLDYWIVLL